jgi:hypothetical protein
MELKAFSIQLQSLGMVVGNPLHGVESVMPVELPEGVRRIHYMELKA